MATPEPQDNPTTSPGAQAPESSSPGAQAPESSSPGAQAPESSSPGAQAPESITLAFDDIHLARALFGERQTNLKELSKHLGIQVSSRGNSVILSGDPTAVKLGARVISELADIAKHGQAVLSSDIVHALQIVQKGDVDSLRRVFEDVIFTSARNRKITPKSLAQKFYVDRIRDHDIVFGIGPAGTGKTYLAMAMAVAALSAKQVSRIVLTRPAVEAGEKLGFLPGDIAEKVNPYLRPLYDALHDMFEHERAAKMVEMGTIEVAPLAFMRGRTLNDSFVILDEAQNSTSEQMKMFLTRLGVGSKAVITGDVTQIDLTERRRSGLLQAQRILRDVEGIAFCAFTEADVVRHRLVQEIIKAYEQEDSEEGTGS